VRDLAILLLHLLTTLARLAGPGGARSVVAASVLLKQQLLILNRSRKRSPHLRLSDRTVAGVCALLVRKSRLIRSAIVLKPSTLLGLHRALSRQKYRRLFSSTAPTKPGPRGPSQDVIAAVVDMKRHNPTWVVQGSRNRSPWRSAFRSTRMWCGASSPVGISRVPRHRGRPGLPFSATHEGQSMESRFVSLRIGRTCDPLGARRDGPLHAPHRGVRRSPRRGRWHGPLPDVQSSDSRPCPADIPQRRP
jgi:hypothetical protein